MRRTVLYDEHIALRARIVPFAGWELPLQYDGIGASQEHLAVRQGVGLFDIDHMGQLRISGPDAAALVDHLQTVDIKRIRPGMGHYGLVLNRHGGVLDDIFLFNLDDAWMVVTNAANRATMHRWFISQAFRFTVRIEDISDSVCMLALQGPKAQATLQRVAAEDISTITYHTCGWVTIAGVRMLVSATGYTGEYGYELYVPVEDAVPIWRALIEAGAPDALVPCGLAARDSLRFEAALPLYGHELGLNIDPYMAGLGAFVHLEKGDFVGRDALRAIKERGVTRKLIGFEMLDKAIPRERYEVRAHNTAVGVVTSGTKSITLKKFLGMAFVDVAHAETGTILQIMARDTMKRAIVVRRPFYMPAYRRVRG